MKFLFGLMQQEIREIGAGPMNREERERLRGGLPKVPPRPKAAWEFFPQLVECFARNEDYVCSREEGHEGLHVAMTQWPAGVTILCDIAPWSDDECTDPDSEDYDES